MGFTNILVACYGGKASTTALDFVFWFANWTVEIGPFFQAENSGARPADRCQWHDFKEDAGTCLVRYARRFDLPVLGNTKVFLGMQRTRLFMNCASPF